MSVKENQQLLRQTRDNFSHYFYLLLNQITD